MSTSQKPNTDSPVYMVFTENPDFLIPAFELAVLYAGWSQEQITEVRDELRDLCFSEQKTLLGEYNIVMWPLFDRMEQIDIQFALDRVGMGAHYLFSKDIETWSSFDWSLFLLFTNEFRERFRFVYAVFSPGVCMEQKYSHFPALNNAFKRKEEFEAFLEKERLKDRLFVGYPVWVEMVSKS